MCCLSVRRLEREKINADFHAHVVKNHMLCRNNNGHFRITERLKRKVLGIFNGQNITFIVFLDSPISLLGIIYTTYVMIFQQLKDNFQSKRVVTDVFTFTEYRNVLGPLVF